MKIYLSVIFSFCALLSKANTSDTLFQDVDSFKIYTTLEEAIKNPNAVLYLDLSKKKLSEFPTEILKFKNLVSLNLAKNKIKTIPAEINQLKKLEEINFSRNKITVIPPSLFDLLRIKKLILNQNLIERIPPEISKLQALEVLDMWSNELWDIPNEIEKLKNLKEFDLRVIQFTPDEQARIKKLLPNTKLLFSQSCNCGN